MGRKVRVGLFYRRNTDFFTRIAFNPSTIELRLVLSISEKYSDVTNLYVTCFVYNEICSELPVICVENPPIAGGSSHE